MSLMALFTSLWAIMVSFPAVVVLSRFRGGDIYRSHASGKFPGTVSSEGLPASLEAPSLPKETNEDLAFSTLITLVGRSTIEVSTDL